VATSHTVAWQGATIRASAPLTDRIQRIVLVPDRPRRVEPGAHVDVRLSIDGEQAVRSYSIVEAVGEEGGFAISVFESDVSRGGARAMRALVPGDRIEVTEPLQDFPLRLGAPAYVFLAGGVGITAILGMARAARKSGQDYRLVYCGRSRADMAYADEVIAEHGQLLSLHVGDEGTSLRVSELVAQLPAGAELYMCGPIRLMDAVRREWADAGRPAADLRFETFGNSGWFAPEPFLVRIPATGAECVVSSSQTLLEALEEAGVDALSDCRKGECGLCEARLLGLEGTVDHRDVFYSERQRDANTKICVCVSRVCGDGERMPAIDLLLT
jgi:vanillate demethylase subunit B (EC 1.14.13.82)